MPNIRSHALIVDDERSIREILARVVQLEGYTPILAESAVAAYVALAEMGDTVALVLLDLTMADMDGLTFRDLLRDTPLVADIPVLVLTGRELDAHLVARLQPATCIPKPMNLAHLREVIRRVAGRVSTSAS